MPPYTCGILFIKTWVPTQPISILINPINLVNNIKIIFLQNKNQIENMQEIIFCSYNLIATRVPLKDLTHMLCLQYFISQTI
jgi:hypothetical protein